MVLLSATQTLTALSIIPKEQAFLSTAIPKYPYLILILNLILRQAMVPEFT